VVNTAIHLQLFVILIKATQGQFLDLAGFHGLKPVELFSIAMGK
jgi:hypothetical protein